MSEQININKNLPDEEIYKQLIPQIENLINEDEPLLSSLSNVIAVLKESFSKISWVGFYLAKKETLYLGPFQGKVACTKIDFGSGVCGTSAKMKETTIVENVHNFPGHIACDSESNSEIVVPLIKNNQVVGVLDLDSYNFSSFNEIDKKYLEQICNLLLNKFSFDKIF
ncbi:GAF domain-containing protein [Stygiobacter electus]|uniref:GAF domain-containing protein n=1 Tax=Stygiobacter electus TaxID=3032292 RepID=A0AAE3NYJ2_9BACT|nr:GAF domain-containing protein [Stygiobacter electus]MDF1610824.1 GAF domain-containing protein [Stygiobacter electus]